MPLRQAAFDYIRPLAAAIAFAGMLPAVALGAPASLRSSSAVVPSCSPQIRFTASYLAESTPGQGPGFLFRIENNTARSIVLAEPVPSSAHWYAHVGRLWLWRASAGRGGSLVDAENPHGPLFAFRPEQRTANPNYLTIPAHRSREWTEWMRADPAIAYQPSCAQCTYYGEHEFQAVFAYAWLPAPRQHIANLLTCGLRSAPVVMPPLDNPQKASSR